MTAKAIARFAKKVEIENGKKRRVVRLIQKDGQATDYTSKHKLIKGIKKELKEEPVDLNYALRQIKEDGDDAEKDRFVITIGDIEPQKQKFNINHLAIVQKNASECVDSLETIRPLYDIQHIEQILDKDAYQKYVYGLGYCPTTTERAITTTVPPKSMKQATLPTLDEVWDD
ncbi:Oidioi.mRNA.OKI2018_I69.chr2.g5034.t1.cds [Oikopleura dioica]|uniref:Oidioi.mRNA.OKI2018_I69.chr2.g5034.t1.cds n=1 Tax=Oikopleura dioica TaxID=34765 RepID=A0ABN7SZ51_OIKDI|nr:Oidioi.mRNA.OKI2018_I69.chr2.g5034.t1.cds [Oikopleura dioica]